MKILILNGSPRPNGNTAKMVAAFSESAENSGHHVVYFNVCKMNIKGCLACEYCHGKGQGTCAQKDDMQEIYKELKDHFKSGTLLRASGNCSVGTSGLMLSRIQRRR